MSKEFCTVEHWFEWRKSQPKGKSEEESVENIHEDLTKHIGWECTDVLYSFLGIYTIGLLAFYPREFKLSNRGYQIRLEDEDKSRQSPYSIKFLAENYIKYTELNETKELKDFIQKYKSIGNICPTWPGGNQDRGGRRVYDLPNFYFNLDECQPWTKHLLEDHPEAHLEHALALQSEKTIQSFLKQMEGPNGENKYKEFLSHICSVIDERERAILTFAETQGIDISQYKHPEKEFLR